MTQVGAQTISASDGSHLAVSSAINVTPAGLNHFDITATPPTTTAGVSFPFTVTARDLYENTVTGYAGTVSFSSTDTFAQTALPTSSTLTNGVGNFNATLTKAGAQTIKAQDGAFSGTSNPINVTPSVTTLAQSTVSIVPANIAVGGTANVTLQAKDTYGNNETAGSLTVAFSLAAGTGNGTFSSTNNNLNGTYSATFTATSAGSNPVAATINSQPVTSAQPVVVIAAGATSTALGAGPIGGAIFGQLVTLTANVSLTPASSILVNGGQVVFTDGALPLGSIAVTNGVATLVTGAIPVGAGQTITATYQGNANFAAAAPATTTYSIAQAGTSASLGALPGSSVFGQSVVFSATVTPASPSGATVNAGNVVFSDGALNLGSAPVINGTATLPATTALPVGPGQTITAVYQGSTNFSAALPATLTYSVSPASTSASLGALPGSSVYGEPVTLTATVTANSPSTSLVNGGTVVFTDGALPLGSATVVNGTATLPTSILPTGPGQTITAVYQGSPNFAAAAQTTITYSVSQADTSVALMSSPTSSAPGTLITFTATVSAQNPSAATVTTGAVTFYDGLTPLTTVTLTGSPVATFMTSALTKGTHTITASYADSANDFNASTSSPLTQIVLNADTLAVTPSANPSVFGQPVSLAIAVTSGAGTPTGTVTVTEGANVLGSQSLVGGLATIPLNGLSVAAHHLVVSYSGDANFAANAANLTQPVNAAATTTTLAPLASTVFGKPVVFSATVNIVSPGAGSLTGATVNFLDGATIIGTGTLAPSGTSYVASYPTTNTQLAFGNHSITAALVGSTDFAVSTSLAQIQTVTAASTKTTLASSAPTGSVWGQPVTFTATVAVLSPSLAPSAAGTVSFYNGTIASAYLIGSSPVTSGAASTVSAALAVGAHNIIAVYTSGNANFVGSTSAAIPLTVKAAVTTTAVASSTGGSSAFGQAVTFTASVAIVSPGAGTLTGGTVNFYNGSAFLGSGILNALGKATLTTSTLSVASHTITAVYAGTANFAASLGTVTQVVLGAPTTTTLVSSLPAGSVYGQAVKFTATVSGATTGTVRFYDGATLLGAAALNTLHQAAFTTAALAANVPHSITAVFAGSGNFAASTSAPVNQTVSSSNTAVTLTASPAGGVALGQTVVYTAKVTAAGGGTPTGSVTFSIDGVPAFTQTLTAGKATFTFSGFASVGPHTIDATYTPADGNYLASAATTLNQSALNAATVTAVASSNPVAPNQPVAIIVTVRGAAGTPTGRVDLYEGSALIGILTLNGNGQAALVLPSLNLGTYYFSAIYTGDSEYAAKGLATPLVVSVTSNGRLV